MVLAQVRSEGSAWRTRRDSNTQPSVSKTGGDSAQVVVEQGTSGDTLDALAVRCAVTPAEIEAIRALIACRPSLDVGALIALLQAAPLRVDAVATSDGAPLAT